MNIFILKQLIKHCGPGLKLLTTDLIVIRADCFSYLHGNANSVTLGISSIFTSIKSSYIFEIYVSWFSFLLQLAEAGLRELREETGLNITSDMCCHGDVKVLALWEVRLP